MQFMAMNHTDPVAVRKVRLRAPPPAAEPHAAARLRALQSLFKLLSSRRRGGMLHMSSYGGTEKFAIGVKVRGAGEGPGGGARQLTLSLRRCSPCTRPCA